MTEGTGESQTGDTSEHATEDLLEELRKENAEITDEIAQAKQRQAALESEHARDIEYGQLLTENVRLKRELASAEAAADAAAVADGAAGLLDTIKGNLEAAVEQSKQAPGPVDTNSGYVEPDHTLPSAADQANANAEVLPEQPGAAPVETSTSPTASTPTGVDLDTGPQAPVTPGEPSASVSEFLTSDPEPDADAQGDGSDKNEE